MSSYVSGRLEFKLYDEPDKWWAVDEDGVEYCIYPLSDVGWDSPMYTCFAQRRVAFDSVSAGLGTYESFEEAAAACDAYDPAADGLLDSLSGGRCF